MSYKSYRYFALVQPDSNADITTLKENLDTFYSKSSKKPNILLRDKEIEILFDNFTFTISFEDSDWIIEESIEMADDFETDYNLNDIDKDKLKLCSKRFYISGSRADANMDYFNDSLFILSQIEKFTGVTILDIG
jgi:hypothetical protein